MIDEVRAIRRAVWEEDGRDLRRHVERSRVIERENAERVIEPHGGFAAGAAGGTLRTMAAATDLLDRLLDPVGRALGPDAARRLVALRADDEVQRRVDELADRANEGTLVPDERSDYEALVAAATVVAVLQAKARKVLAGPSAA